MASPRKADVRFREREELLDFLLELSTVTAETLDLDKLLPQVADFIARVIPHEVFAILLYSDKQHSLRVRYARGHRDEVVRNVVIPVGEGLTGIAAQKRRPVLSNNVLEDRRYIPTIDAVRSELAVPMIARNKLVGVIDIQATRTNAFSEQDTSLLRLLATRAAASIDNARLHKRIERQSRTRRLMLELATEFSSTLQLDELLSRIAKAMRSLIDYDAFSILLLDAEQACLRHRFSERYDQRVVLDNIPLGKGITGAAAEQRETLRVEDTLADPRYIASHPDIRSEVAVPLIVHDRVVGVLDLESERIAYFTDEHMRILSLIAPQIAISVENARLYEELAQREQRMEQDLKAARKVQSVLLPREAPEVEGLQIGIGHRPAREITGDIYDFFEYGDQYSLIAFGDSSGKGAAAALYGSLVSGLLRTVGFRKRSPAEMLRLLNSILLERRVDAHFVTLLVLQWDVANKRLVMANAGSMPPAVCRRGERVHVRVEGIPLGLLEDRGYEEATFEAESGDVILLYSDGLEDQLNTAGEEFGEARLFRALREYCGTPPQAIVNSIFSELDAFSEGAPLTDDQTMVVLKVT
ncbi:MAG TPA: GAF domain-containing protein [Bryobacteraceae bacterium]|nr:GAF domain-containing protein [Bryobacteraceae bacterium]